MADLTVNPFKTNYSTHQEKFGDELEELDSTTAKAHQASLSIKVDSHAKNEKLGKQISILEQSIQNGPSATRQFFMGLVAPTHDWYNPKQGELVKLHLKNGNPKAAEAVMNAMLYDDNWRGKGLRGDALQQIKAHYDRFMDTENSSRIASQIEAEKSSHPRLGTYSSVSNSGMMYQ